ncbi:DUF1993 family protein [Aurantiacibacter sediminis]|uniref:DUF1993 domain-containing protein n=1 Tax=Aurantiacibacter sediminis TaxID=2793064 RepID=A0ABS0N5Y7_9SPHN|nr:DUF1993 family protein [Aurantiacibacter sediminis]MBH5323191.1 DUF1993 domain-containing protein [Aurantiacibacter sediminis]
MALSLYEAVIPTMIQMLNAGQDWIEAAKSSDMAEEEIASARLQDDMWPFAEQVKCMIAHSLGAVEGVRAGQFSPDLSEPAMELEKMRLNLGAAENSLRALSKGELDSFIGGKTHFVFKQRGIDLPFKSEDFLLSFSQPNFFFHATTAYAILRMKGVKIGKSDYLGQIRMMRD